MDDTDLQVLDLRGGDVPDATWAVAHDAPGDEGCAELAFLVGSYSLISALLNGFASTVCDN